MSHLHDFKFVKRFKWISGRWHVLYRCRYCDRQIIQPETSAAAAALRAVREGK